jgi:hypothetical protein
VHHESAKRANSMNVSVAAENGCLASRMINPMLWSRPAEQSPTPRTPWSSSHDDWRIG